MKSIRIGIVGIGKIARDQHVPTLRAQKTIEFVACASRHAKVDGVANFQTIEAMLDGCAELDAVAICTPPQVHYDAAKLALSRGKHVLLEKPPCATTAQLDQLAVLAREANRTLYQTWHSRHAQGVAPARQWLSSRKIHSVSVTWKEDVRKWHPGQTWIWQAGGFGVFDPGINAISILTEIVQEPIFVNSATLFIPSNCEAPIAADLAMVTCGATQITATFDFRHIGVQTWDINIVTDKGTMKLSDGGDKLSIDDVSAATTKGRGPHIEYEALYRRFAELIETEKSEVDRRPFQLVADAFLVGQRRDVEPFVE